MHLKVLPVKQLDKNSVFKTNKRAINLNNPSKLTEILG